MEFTLIITKLAYNMKIIRTKSAEMFIDEHGIFHKKVIENCHLDLETLKESVKATEELTKGKRVLMLYDARAHFTLTEDAMDYAQKDIFNKKRIATAIISNKLAIKITVDYMVKIMKTTIPIKVFSNQEEAIEWLLSLKGTGNKKAKISA